VPHESGRKILHTIKFPLINLDGSIFGLGGIASDVTEHRQTEQRLRQAQKMEAVGQLTGGVAHDFNNLLAVIQGNAELLAIGGEPETSSTEAILRATQRGAELTQRLLSYSRRQSLHAKSIDLAELVGGLSDLLRRTLGATIEIETVVAPDLRPACADPGQLENALLNLTINARDAMPEGGKLTIECTNAVLEDEHSARDPDVSPGDYVVLAVSDTGTGMSKEVLAQVFEPFFTTKEVGQGSGLGLSMVYGFAKQSGGQVTLYSKPERGTTVKLYLPQADRAEARHESGAADEIERGHGERVLVIEDDAAVRDLTVTMLENLGYRVSDVGDAAAARSVLKGRDEIDLILSDVVLPGGMTGPQFIDEIRERTPDVKVVFMSGYPAEAAKRADFVSAGGTLLNKPFRRGVLAKALRDALG
jgi:signal transduction histidine kinase